jgi:hypothetical protein
MWKPDDSTALGVLGDWLARWRRQAGISQRSLAWRGGLSHVERGLEAVGSRRLARLVMTLDELCGQGPMGSMPPPPVQIRRRQVLEDDVGDLDDGVAGPD